MHKQQFGLISLEALEMKDKIEHKFIVTLNCGITSPQHANFQNTNALCIGCYTHVSSTCPSIWHCQLVNCPNNTDLISFGTFQRTRTHSAANRVLKSIHLWQQIHLWIRLVSVAEHVWFFLFRRQMLNKFCLSAGSKGKKQSLDTLNFWHREQHTVTRILQVHFGSF